MRLYLAWIKLSW